MFLLVLKPLTKYSRKIRITPIILAGSLLLSQTNGLYFFHARRSFLGSSQINLAFQGYLHFNLFYLKPVLQSPALKGGVRPSASPFHATEFKSSVMILFKTNLAIICLSVVAAVVTQAPLSSRYHRPILIMSIVCLIVLITCSFAQISKVRHVS